ncbi:MAG: ATP-binding protein [Pseudomonadota bacterium]
MWTRNSNPDQTRSAQAAFAREKYRLLYEQIALGHWWTLPLSLVAAYYLYDASHGISVPIWVAAHTVYLVVSYFYLIKPFGLGYSGVPAKWFNRLTVHNLVIGSLWAYLPFLVQGKLDVLMLVYLYLQLFGLILGGTVILAAHFKAYLTWALPMAIGAFGFSWLYPYQDFVLMAQFTVIVLVVSIIFALHIQTILNTSIGLRIANDELLADLEQKKKQAETANAQKSLFLAAASHDLRQPLQAAELFAESMHRDLPEGSTRELSERLRAALNGLSNLTNTLLDLSRLDGPRVSIEKEPFALDSLLKPLCVEASEQAAQKQLQVRFRAAGHRVYSDPVLLQRCVRNLIDNAIRYTETGGLLVTSRSAVTTIKLQVWDTGVGIPEDKFAEIFSAFQQLGNAARDRRKGFGLGLAVVKETTQILGHELEVRSELGKGSVFSIQIPRADDSAAIKDLDSTPIGLEGKRILLVEDDIDIQDAMALLMRNWGCDVKVAVDSSQATTVLDSGFSPELVVCDYRLPGKMNGAELLEHIAAQAPVKIAKILLTGEDASALDLPATFDPNQLLKKPVAAAKLRSVLATQLRRH